MGTPAGWMKGLTCREAMKSPGAPSHRREIERQFWEVVKTGVTTEAAATAVGVSSAVGTRWFRHRGGMPTFMAILSHPLRQDRPDVQRLRHRRLHRRPAPLSPHTSARPRSGRRRTTLTRCVQARPQRLPAGPTLATVVLVAATCHDRGALVTEQSGTLRERLLKIAGVFEASRRRIILRLSAHAPSQLAWTRIAHFLQANAPQPHPARATNPSPGSERHAAKQAHAHTATTRPDTHPENPAIRRPTPSVHNHPDPHTPYS